MSFLIPTLITAGLLGIGLSVGAADHQESVPERMAVSASKSNYSEAQEAAAALRGASVAALAGEPVSLEFFTSLLRAGSFGPASPAPAEWTLFLPVDAAFTPIAGAQLDALIHDRAALEAILDAHIADQLLTADDLQSGVPATTRDGEPLKAVFDDGLRINGATVIAEQAVGNGRVYIIDRLL